MAACWNLYVFLPFSVFISVFSPFSATFQKTAPCLSSKDLELSALLLCILNTMFHSIGRLHTLDSTIGICVCQCVPVWMCVFCIQIQNLLQILIFCLKDGPLIWNHIDLLNTIPMLFLWNCVWTACICNLCIKGGCVLYVCFVVCFIGLYI